jgi:hypothetical protein
MDRAYQILEFEVFVEKDGSLTFPAAIVRKLRRGKHFVVRLSEGTIIRTLRRRGITEDDIEEIARMQLEPRENIIQFLLSEGAFGGNKSISRRRTRNKRRAS